MRADEPRAVSPTPLFHSTFYVTINNEIDYTIPVVNLPVCVTPRIWLSCKTYTDLHGNASLNETHGYTSRKRAELLTYTGAQPQCPLRPHRAPALHS